VGAVGIVPHPIGKARQRAEQLIPLAKVSDNLIERALHAQQPSVALRLSDLEADMLHAKPRMAALLGLKRRASQPFAEIALQHILGRGQVGRVHGADGLGLGQCVHAGIEGLDQAIDARGAADA
jgi:hypothetical protein